MLRSYLDPAHCNTWDDHLPLIQFAYNSSRHTATELTPHYVLFGREARLPLDLMCPMPDAALRWVPPMSYVIDLRKRLEAAYQHVKQHLNFAQCRAKAVYDRKSHGSSLVVGDLVWLHRHPPAGVSPKLLKHWDRPWQVLVVHSALVYTIKRLAGQSRGSQRQTVHRNKIEESCRCTCL